MFPPGFFGATINIVEVSVFFILALLINLFISVLAIMFGRLFGKDDLVSFGKTESLQTFFSLFTVAIIVLFLINSSYLLEILINNSEIARALPGICSSPVYRSYVYEISPVRYVYSERVVDNRPTEGMLSHATNYIIIGIPYLITSILNYVFHTPRIDLTEELKPDGKYLKSKPEIGIRDPVSKQPAPYPCHFATANLYLDTLVWNEFTFFSELMMLYDIYAVFGSLSYSLEARNAATPYIGINPLAFLEYVAEAVKYFAETIGRLINISRLLQNIILLTHIALFPLCLAIGFILRAVFFTRKLGGLLIAIALGLYFALPIYFDFMMLMLIYAIPTSVTHSSLAFEFVTFKGVSVAGKVFSSGIVMKWLNPVTVIFAPSLSLLIFTKICSYLNLDFLNNRIPFLGTLLSNILTRIPIAGIITGGLKVFLVAVISLIMVLSVFMNTFILAIAYLGYANAEPPFFVPGGFAETTALYLIYGGILPFIGIIGTIVFVKNLSPLLGGDTDIAGLARFI